MDLLLSEDGVLSWFAPMVLTAVTMYPDQEEKRDQLLIAIAVKTMTTVASSESETEVKIATDWLDLILRSPPVDKIVSDAATYSANSWIAGELILFMISAAVHHPELDVTLTKGVWALPRLLGGERTWSGGTFSASQRTVWKAWSRFKSVAHLHAVRQIWLQERKSEPDPDMKGFVALQNERTLDFLAMSEVIRKAAVERRILRHDDTWRPPEGLELPIANLEIPRLPESATKKLAKYRPEYARDAGAED